MKTTKVMTKVNTNSQNNSLKNSNSSDDYDYESAEESTDECPTESFVDKAKKLHEEGKGFPLTKNVKHINETFALLKNLKNVLSTLFGISEREKYKAIEFFSEIDFNISPTCMSSLVQTFQAVSNAELWAIKCKSI